MSPFVKQTGLVFSKSCSLRQNKIEYMAVVFECCDLIEWKMIGIYGISLKIVRYIKKAHYGPNGSEIIEFGHALKL